MSRISGSRSTLRYLAERGLVFDDEGMLRLYVKVWYWLFTRRMFSGLRSVWMRLRSCKTVRKGQRSVSYECKDEKHTSNAGEELASKLLNVGAGKGYELVALKKVKDTLAEQVSDNADVVAEVKRVSQVDTLVAVVLVVACQRRQDS